MTFTFRSPAKGATFRCALDRARPVVCRSPKRYRVKAGRHRFVVRAVLKGVQDPTPATFTFRAVRRR